MRSSTRVAAIAALLLLVRVGCHGQAAETQPVLRSATTVSVQYYVSLPEGWTADRSWPILVTLDGASHDFLGNCQGFIQARGNQPFILVTPWVTSNGNDPADARAVLAIVKEVQHERHGQPRFYLTGFSAGGHVTWQLVFAHPERLAGVAPACANFRNRGVSAISDSPDRERLPIHAFQGDQDPGLSAFNDQWNAALLIAHEHEYHNIDRTIVKGIGHSPCAQQVVAFLATLLRIPGDMDGDGKVTLTDAIIALRIVTGLVQPSTSQLQAGDLDGSGEVAIGDVVKILEFVIGAITSP